MSDVCVKARVSGKVQGVWYRRSTQQEAISLGVTGHAINLADGSVEVLMYGTSTQVDTLSQWLWQGSKDAQVTHVELASVKSDASSGVPETFTTG